MAAAAQRAAEKEKADQEKRAAAKAEAEKKKRFESIGERVRRSKHYCDFGNPIHTERCPREGGVVRY